ncbi:hypothetical protein JAAARDRAFT_198101 [Jaapia argillacea MUCL 33604]|uniref:DUF7918 domain-containing protein n=1 Tax=Jaapia argillacea MUCL 33604 TaxID=933084 RepID=A0A067PCX5_9AGAM|nr:hypothetical protein JAAARDRAFT_198101 [Jaapia argillacea MUCL 33604]
MLLLNNFQAWVSVDGVELEQYKPDVSADGSTITCWIASEAGKASFISPSLLVCHPEREKKLAVKWKNTTPILECTVGGFVFLDGLGCGGRLRSPSNGNVVPSCTDSIITSETSQDYFTFTKLELTEDDCSVNTSAKIGEIKLVLYKCELSSHLADYPPSPPSLRKISERSKKAGTHCVGFEEGALATKQPIHIPKFSDPTPIATFIFLYRPLVPVPNRAGEKRSRSASNQVKPELEGVKIEGEDGSEAEEIRVLQERLNELQAQHARKRVKAEPISHQGVFKQGEVIDLT